MPCRHGGKADILGGYLPQSGCRLVGEGRISRLSADAHPQKAAGALEGKNIAEFDKK
jgi:hypothetical protein